MDRHAFLALLAPGFIAKGSMGPQGVDGAIIWEVMMAFRKTFPNIKWELAATRTSSPLTQ